SDRPLEKIPGDAVVVGVGKGPDGPLPTPGAEAVDRLLGGRLLPALADLGARGGEEEVTRLPSLGQCPFPVVVVAGLGAPGAGGEGSLLGAYEFTRYKSELPADRPQPPQSFTVVVPDAGAAGAPLERVRAVADAVTLVRDLVNTPPNDLYPAELAERGAAAGTKAGLTVEILDEAGLAAGGYGGILAVGGGAARGPRALRVAYPGPKARAKAALGGTGGAVQ